MTWLGQPSLFLVAEKVLIGAAEMNQFLSI